MTRRTLLTLSASPLLRASDPFEDRWRAVADRIISAPPNSIGFSPSDALLTLGLMRLHQRTRYPLYADFVEAWARHHLARGLPPDSAPSLAILLLHESRPHALFERYVKLAVESAVVPEDASFLARYGMVRREPGLVLRAARSLPTRLPVSPRTLLTIADVMEALEPMQWLGGILILAGIWIARPRHPPAGGLP